NVSVPAAFELKHVRVGDGEHELFGVGAFRRTELERRQTVAVFGAVHIWRVGVEVWPHHPADFAMRDGAFADELNAGSQNEIAFHFFPCEMELVGTGPHVRSRAGEGVFLGRRVVTGGGREFRRTDVAMPLKLPE